LEGKLSWTAQQQCRKKFSDSARGCEDSPVEVKLASDLVYTICRHPGTFRGIVFLCSTKPELALVCYPLCITNPLVLLHGFPSMMLASAGAARLADICRPASGAVYRSLPTAVPTVVQRPVAKLSVRVATFPLGLPHVRGAGCICRPFVPPVVPARLGRCVPVHLALPLPSRVAGPDWGDCRSKPVPGGPVTWPAFSPDGLFSGRQLRGRSS
jgi:hypothetical protein